MAAKDIFHNAVKNALQKEGWTITHDPFFIRVDGVELLIDLGAERLIAAMKQNEKIAVEIKSFVGPSNISEFHMALGQFLNYQQALEQSEPSRVLYLAVPLDTYEAFFALRFIQTAIHRHQLKLIIYEPGQEAIVKWQI